MQLDVNPPECPGCGDSGIQFSENVNGWRCINHKCRVKIFTTEDMQTRNQVANDDGSAGSPVFAVGLRSEIETLRTQVKELRRQVGFKDESLARKNQELDAMHFVWCDGGCNGGVHRWQDAPPTEEIVELAERNTRRLRAWWMSHLARKERENSK